MMSIRCIALYGACCFALTVLGQGGSAQPDYLNVINFPGERQNPPRTNPVIVAIVDDGVALHHETIKPFLWTNPAEIAGNHIDDDGNGFTDDLHGWDVSDSDPSPVPPRPREADLYHGTHLASILIQMAEAAYGAAAPQHLKIMAVKCIPDSSPTTYLMDAYQGIEYALDNNADLILCAWGLSQLSTEESALLDRVSDQGVLLIASAGNFAEERDQYPAAHPAAIAVSGLDTTQQKLPNSTYGTFVDLLAPAENMPGIEITGGSTNRTGTSFSAAVTAGAAVLIKNHYPEYSAEQLKACLLNSASPLAAPSRLQEARLGAGKLNLGHALNTGDAHPADSPIRRTKGYLPLDSLQTSTWTLNPPGKIKGLRFTLVPETELCGTLKLYRDLSATGKSITKRLPLAKNETLFIPGSKAHITFTPDQEQAPPTFLTYSAEPIDLSTLYCSGTQYIDQEGLISDGSGTNLYAPNTDAKWLITAPPGKEIQFNFTHFDTEVQTDKIYLFNGTGTHELVMAVLSGPERPPKITSWSNEALLWFVSDGKNERQGWQVEISFVEPIPTNQSTLP